MSRVVEARVPPVAPVLSVSPPSPGPAFPQSHLRTPTRSRIKLDDVMEMKQNKKLDMGPKLPMTPTSRSRDKGLRPSTPTKPHNHLPSPERTPNHHRGHGSPRKSRRSPSPPADSAQMMSDFMHSDEEDTAAVTSSPGKRKASALLHPNDRAESPFSSSGTKGKQRAPDPESSGDELNLTEDTQRTPRRASNTGKERTPFTPRRLLFGPGREPKRFSPSWFKTPSGPRELHHSIYDPYDSPAFLEDELNRLENPETSPGSFFGRRRGLLYESPVHSKTKWRDWDPPNYDDLEDGL
jgi:hypothetical protein